MQGQLLQRLLEGYLAFVCVCLIASVASWLIYSRVDPLRGRPSSTKPIKTALKQRANFWHILSWNLTILTIMAGLAGYYRVEVRPIARVAEEGMLALIMSESFFVGILATLNFQFVKERFNFSETIRDWFRKRAGKTFPRSRRYPQEVPTRFPSRNR